MANWKRKFWEIFKTQFIKYFLTLVVIFLNTPKKQSKRIIETEPTRWLQSKDPWKSEWIRYFTKDSVWNIEKWTLKVVKNKRNNI